MRPRARLWRRLLFSHLVVIAIGSATLFVAVGLVGPGAFDAAMGHAMAGMEGMSDMMTALVRSAYQDALQAALGIAIAAAAVAAVVASIALATRVSRPIGHLAQAAGRIASGHYAERVPLTSDDEVGQLAESFNAMAASLESTERRRLQLVGDVAHELRTPLATIDGYLEGIEDGVIRPRDATWLLLRGETARLARIVNDLQELWRAEARQLPLSMATVDVETEVLAAAQRFATQAQEHGIEIRRLVEHGRPAALADTERLGQILDNFLSNAIRYSPRGSVVTLSAAREGDGVAVSVIDQGPGLTEEQLERVFERFYRADPSRSRALGGSGIGLAIARALAEAMGGHVEALSEGEGRGATFRVVLPAA
jgi:two-component system sensor histidine kinase BaeS